jgi:hypothetical protein
VPSSCAPQIDFASTPRFDAIEDKVRFVRVGTLDDADRAPPDIHIFTSSKQRWVIPPPGVPAVAEYYDRNEHWPLKSLARRRALLG